MKKQLKILLSEDVLSDVFLIEREFKKSKINYDLKVVSDRQTFQKKLIIFKPDIVLTDFYMPDFNGIDVITTVREFNPTIPVIIITGALDEETAVNCIKAGADDYLTKEKLIRLIPAVKSAIEKKNALKEKEIEQKKSFILTRELQLLIQTVNTPIIRIDQKGNIKEWNFASEKLFGYLKNEVKHKNFISLFVPESCRHRLYEFIKKTSVEQNVRNYELTINAKKGTKNILINITKHQITVKGSYELTILAQDISGITTYREELERQVKERTEKLRDALRKEKELTEMKSRFVSMASHEFRTPLAAIGFAAGFLKKYIEKVDRETINKKLDKISNQINHMTDLLDDVLTVGKVQSYKKLNLSQICFNTFVTELIDEINSVTNYSHNMITNFSDKNIQLTTDVSLLRKIFMNLLTNAIKFSPKKDRVIFDCTLFENNLICKVTDFGIGISKEDCKQIFIPFHRGKNAETIQGTGLGLPIVKDSAEVLGGKVNVKSKPNIETTFTVILPIKTVIV